MPGLLARQLRTIWRYVACVSPSSSAEKWPQGRPDETIACVVSYLRKPIVLVLEVLFLIVVAIHVMLGVRAIVIDFGISSQAEKRLSQALTVIGVLTVGYGLWLTWAIIH